MRRLLGRWDVTDSEDAMNDRRHLSRPSGMPPPTRATLPDGQVVDLGALAAEISVEHMTRHPDDLARYGEVGREWCVHDNQHLLNWAVLEVCGGLDFGPQVAWLAGVLGSRGYPLESLADDLRMAAQTVRRRLTGEHARQLADVLERGIDFVDPG